MFFGEKSYWDIRESLCDFFSSHMDVCADISFIAYEIYKKIDKPLVKELNTFENILKLLVEGYLVTPIKELNLIDPCNLLLNVIDDKIVWEEYNWKDVVNTYNFNDIYYLTYDSNTYISLVDQISKNGFDIDNDIQLADLVNSITNIFTDYEFDLSRVVKKECNTIDRIFKLNKINDSCK
jgi:hypothetical protein